MNPWRVLSFLVLVCAAGNAAATPPASCAAKFIGKWQHGTSNQADLTADGRAICSGNAFCTHGTWTCDGNSLTYTTSAGTYVYTLQPNGTMTYNSIVVTRIGPAPAAATAASQSGKPGRCNQNEAKTNLEWIFSNDGAKRTFAAARSQGKAPLDAALQAQGHNAHAQQTLRDCAGWVEAQLAGRGEKRSDKDLPNRPLSQADCKCLTVQGATGGSRGYNVNMSPTCDTMDIVLKLTGDNGGMPGGSLPLSSNARVGILRAGATKVVGAPNWSIVSLRAVTLRNASSSFVCNL